MNHSQADAIVRAVLYEGYNLYPYRPSVKSRHRWTFGGLYPPSYSGVREGSDAASFEMQCLVRGESSRVAARVLFLHLRWRRIGRLPQPIGELFPGAETACEFVDSLEIRAELHQTWQEAVEREVSLQEVSLAELAAQPRVQTFAFAGEHTSEPIRDAQNQIVGLTIYDREAIEGSAELRAERVEGNLYRLILRVQNDSRLDVTLDPAAQTDREAALMRTLASTNAVLHVEGGKFLSLTDPPAECQAAAAALQNRGVWPVLLGTAGDGDSLLASPIILYDYPRIAPESPGDLFDGTEIDEILTLRIMTMTDEEKKAARAVDDRTRRLMERTETLAREQLAGLHGALRVPPPLPESPSWPSEFDSGLDLENFARLDHLPVPGGDVRPGDHVLLRPKPGGDVFDLALQGRIATVESIEQDFENRIFLAVTVDDDPGRDLGRAQKPGHRFFFKPNEVELLETAAHGI